MLFVDESIQHDLGYICVGFAYCADPPDAAIAEALSRAGLAPGVDEYKSGARMTGSPALQALRDDIYALVLMRCRMGVYVAPVSERGSLLSHVAAVAGLLVERNGLDQPQRVYVDQGINGPVKASDSIELFPGCDSRLVPGIQLADFVAYHCSFLLKAAVTGSSKKIRMDDTPHPLANEEVDLDWIIRTEFRRSFFVDVPDYDENDLSSNDDMFYKLSGFGAFFSPQLDGAIRSAAESTFDTMYYGCVW